MLSGASIGGLPLGRAPVTTVDPIVVQRLGKATIGELQLCESATERAELAVVDHVWPGLTVRYGSSGAAAVAVGWTVDLDDVPEGFQLANRLPWRPPFAALTALPGVAVGTSGGRRYARLEDERITWWGPPGSARPDTVTGGPQLDCG